MMNLEKLKTLPAFLPFLAFVLILIIAIIRMTESGIQLTIIEGIIVFSLSGVSLVLLLVMGIILVVNEK